MNAMSKCLRYALACMFFALSPSVSAGGVDDGDSYLSDLINVKVRGITCGGGYVIVMSVCGYLYEDTARCFYQDVIFSSGGKVNNKYSFTYGGEFDGQIVSVSCFRRGSDLVVLGSGNYGNCDACEWEDVFSEYGVYIGSTRKKFGASDFHYKAIDREDLRELMSSPPVASKVIDRTFKR